MKEGKARAASLYTAPCSQSSGYVYPHLSLWVTLRAWPCHTPSLVIFVLSGGLSLGTIHFNFDLGVRLSTELGGGNSGVCASCPCALPCCFLLTSCALEKLSQDALRTLPPQDCYILPDFHWWLSPKCWNRMSPSYIWLKEEAKTRPVSSLVCHSWNTRGLADRASPPVVKSGWPRWGSSGF